MTDTFKRKRVIKITDTFLRDLFTTDDAGVWSTPIRVSDGLPKGASYRGCFDEPQYGNVCFVFEHESFEEVEEGAYPLSVHVLMQSTWWGLHQALKRLYEQDRGVPKLAAHEKDWELVAEAFGLEDR